MKRFARMKPFKKKTQPHQSYTIAPGSLFSIRFRQGEFKEVSPALEQKLKKVWINDDRDNGCLFSFYAQDEMEDQIQAEYIRKRREIEEEFFGKGIPFEQERETMKIRSDASRLDIDKKSVEEEWGEVGDEMKEIADPNEDYFGDVAKELDDSEDSEDSEEEESVLEADEEESEEEAVQEPAKKPQPAEKTAPKKVRKTTKRRA